ncbi:hypothetical protein RO575_08865 [Methylomonas sp. MO1]|uniref:hypothetical protein n=1 Tax=Methylomonas sp. MO1 TaxID=3073619 RepID=UPI0028A39E2B|nr:hypothetical protein [Methylomonas sp. MO1]MDT4289669.1 hypothetical protein [Methylomonas sp. MO1]
MKIIKKIVKWLLLIVALCLTSMPLWPLYYKWFVPYPKLEEATIYHGILSVEGESTWKTNKCNVSLRYYVTDEAGKHEIYYGLPGCREYVLSHAGDNRAIGTYWFHTTFGVIQSDYLQIIDPKTQATGKERMLVSYEKKKELFEQHFDYKNTFIRGIPFFLLLIYLVRSTAKLIGNRIRS